MDFKTFGLKHTLGINTGIRLSKLINSFGKLENLFIININPFVEQMLKLIKLILDKKYHKCIHIIKPNDPITNEINQWNILDNYRNKNILSYVLS